MHADDICACGHTRDEHGGDPDYPGLCTVCACIKFDSSFPADIFEAYARRDDPPPSHKAAASLTPDILNELEARVFKAIKLAGAYGATSREIAAATGIDLQSVTPRPARLKEKGFIIDCGVRKGPTGRDATVWKTPEFKQP